MPCEEQIPYMLLSYPSGSGFSGRAALATKFHQVTEKPEGRYLALYQLGDLWSIERVNHLARQSGTEYALDNIGRTVGDELRSGHCFLAFDLSHEGHLPVQGALDDLHSWCDENDINIENIGLISQNRNFEFLYRSMYPKRHRWMRCFTYDLFVYAIAELLAQPEPAFSKLFGFSRPTNFANRINDYEKWFLCQNAHPKPVRLAVLAGLEEAGLLPHTLWSLMNDGAKYLPGPEAILASLEQVGAARLFDRCLSLLHGPSRYFDIPAMKDTNNLAGVIARRSYEQTFMSIITETDFSDGSNFRITEKIIKAFAMAHPALIVGNPRSLQLLRKIGFRTFSPMIDEAYDEIDEPRERFAALFSEIIRIAGILSSNDKNFVGALNEIGASNASHALSGELHRKYLQVVGEPLAVSLASCVQRRQLPSKTSSFFPWTF